MKKLGFRIVQEDYRDVMNRSNKYRYVFEIRNRGISEDMPYEIQAETWDKWAKPILDKVIDFAKKYNERLKTDRQVSAGTLGIWVKD